ncbi:hypothetical protein SAMN05660909_05496 [Chitinophaga terrae (ex Kim and Jung 2007)]|uniref:Uncharacterized protein n=1 Tax=Chitinophaga terrae (ex Kim and Jung 2007) TaxID=408074 RepID=A0A1H4GLR4_9BACT|nr:hypothetical protein [Chitinophaga terrae (ex Kim and Jung 2007)]GEP93585.1 hypothetical protein CTE07_52300 [Chitinophaga terrae (ex Kim and Jung 2007)]SEB10589.1 hypothetical protein SAMN05660909_05496 [Chitinophaga terrae (ex Kim and Jung 2007)]
MKDAILITDSTVELLDFKRYARGLFEFEEANEFEIEYYIPYEQESYFSISKDNSMFDLIEPDGQKIIVSEFDKFNVFACLFYEFGYVQSLIVSIPSDRKIIVDNDHGAFIRREDFLKLNSYEEFVKWSK